MDQHINTIRSTSYSPEKTVTAWATSFGPGVFLQVTSTVFATNH